MVIDSLEINDGGSDKDIHERLCELFGREGAVYCVVEHEPEGRTEFIAKIRGNKPEQAIKSIVVQVRFGKKESRYYLATCPVIAAWI